MLEQEVQIVGPSGVDVVYDTRELGHLWRDYIYEAEEPGRYQIYVRYAGFELPGCPFTQEIADGGMPSASGSGLFFAEQDKPAQFIVDVGRRKGDLRVSVNGPTSVGRCTVDPNTDGSYTVTYVPVETGIFNVNLSWNGTDIPGSPYHPKVVDVRKVRVIGGWQHFMDSNERVNLVVGERKQLPFDIAEAGPGTLRAEVKGPSGSLHASVDNHTMGKSVVEFIPEEEGSHYIHLFWSDLPLVNSPFHGYAIQQVPDASKLILTGRGLKEATVREEAEFVIDGSQAGKGSPDVVLSGVRDEVNVRVSPLGNGKFRCNYVATVPGAYLLHITWNGRQLRGSPYKVNVIGAFYPNRVVVSGEGLRGGILGQRIDVVIDTRKAGPGELTAHCMGPHQVAFCELADSKDGTFNLGIKAQESGRHVLQIKYGGEHVEGSPFTFKVNSRPDASKVRVHGPGVENGILATYVSKFIVETKGAGAGQLTVRIRGPKGAFQVEMYRDSQRDRTIVCRFDPTECGMYIIQVRWSNVDVPGSPFNVHILDTTEELEQVLNENSYSIGTPRSQSSYGNRPATRMVHQGGSLPAPRTQYGQWRGQVYPGQ
ncbi:filamin-A-like [Dreissena polymorpha]|uniref:filamin-A-like n=1 Tax=Dreissena polymorpha TaxID=45954 RepID=UPI002265460F|nr:filamin-A-like [Dreissena polymorpha]